MLKIDLSQSYTCTTQSHVSIYFRFLFFCLLAYTWHSGILLWIIAFNRVQKGEYCCALI